MKTNFSFVTEIDKIGSDNRFDGDYIATNAHVAFCGIALSTWVA